jgi:ribosomal protein S12 methylthiotransferase accessory factor
MTLLDRKAAVGLRKNFRSGQHRLVDPTETLAKVQPLMPAMGITRVANITGLDRIGIPVVMVCRPNSRSLAVSQGKGLTLDAAKASGVMESVETYHAETIGLPLKLNSQVQMMAGHAVLDGYQLARPRTSRFDPELRILWVEGQDLLQEEPVWVPYELVSTDWTLELQSGEGCFSRDGNGLASGNHPLEAISHAICEVVERDAWTLWLLKDEMATTRIDLDSVDDPDCRALLELYERAGVLVAIWEMTQDLAIPCFRCLIVEKADDPFRLLYATYGQGCHPSRPIALLRALTEAAQSRLTMIAGTRDDMPRSEYDRVLDPEAPRRLRQLIQTPTPVRHFREGRGWEAESFEDDVATELERLREAAVERVVVVDLTQPALGIPVVKVIIPGLEGAPIAPHYMPGQRGRRVGAR